LIFGTLKKYSSREEVDSCRKNLKLDKDAEENLDALLCCMQFSGSLSFWAYRVWLHPDPSIIKSKKNLEFHGIVTSK
jgi:hypothetical protein